MNDQQPVDASFSEIEWAISEERMKTYLMAAGHNRSKALALYLWNARIGEAFHLPIQAVEVALRNAINRALCKEFGQVWWNAERFTQMLDQDRANDLELVKRRIANRKLALTNGQIVAGLSFGFWAGMLQPRYNPAFWSKYINSAFPGLPHGRGRKSLAAAVAQIATLRNRISHHEPLLKRDHFRDYGLVMETLSWTCPAKSNWIKPHCKVPELIRAKPKG